MLKLKSSARLNRRYILLDGKKEEVEKAILDYIGILGWAKASPQFIRSEKLTLAVNREEVNNVIGSFALSKDKIKVLRVSGTLKGLEK